MSAGLVEDENGVSAGGDLGGDFIEMELHSFAVAGWQHECGAGSVFRTYGPEHVGRLGALVMDGAGTRAPLGPAIGELVFLTDPHLVLEPHFYGCARREFLADFRHTKGKVFLNASMASGFCL
jgi:hypothetical protein